MKRTKNSKQSDEYFLLQFDNKENDTNYFHGYPSNLLEKIICTSPLMK